MNTSETIPFSWLFWQQSLSQSCCHTSLPVQSLNIWELFVSMLVVNHSPTLQEGDCCVPLCSQQNPHPKLWKTQKGWQHSEPSEWVQGEMGKWSRDSDQTELQHLSGKEERFAVIWPQYILWSVAAQARASALLQGHQPVETFNSLQAHKWTPLHHWECSDTGIWKHTREHSYQSTQVPRRVCFYEH